MGMEILGLIIGTIIIYFIFSRIGKNDVESKINKNFATEGESFVDFIRSGTWFNPCWFAAVVIIISLMIVGVGDN